MSFDPFSLLGLDRKTASEADIRKAYAERLKLTRPEDNREGFMALREAFERARQEVRWRTEYPEEQEEDEDAYEDMPMPASQPVPEPAPSAAPDAAQLAEADAAQDYEDEEDDYAPSDLEQRIGNAIDQLQQLLASPWGPPSSTDLTKFLNQPDLEGIDEYRAMQWHVRGLICHATGYYSDAQELQLPPWLTLRVFDDLDAQFGWVRQPSSHPAERHMNAWLRRVREEADWHSMPQEVRKQRELDRLLGRTPESPNGTPDGSNTWLFIGAGILVFVVIRALTGLGG